MVFFVAEQRSLLETLYPQAADEYCLLLKQLGDFLEGEVAPTAAETDRRRLFPRANVQKLFTQGLTELPFPREAGGLGYPYTVYVAALEMTAKACASTAITLAIHGTVCEGVSLFGSPELKKRYFKLLISGEKLASFALTEPEAGSDARSMKTSAEPRGDHYYLKGSKMFITNGGEADVYCVFARAPEGYVALLVDRNLEGLRVGGNIEKMGIRGSRLTEVFLDGCRVPRENLLGVEGEGFTYAKHMLTRGRVTVAALSVGIAQAAYEKSLAYSRERIQFAQPISNFQLIQEKIANMAIQINAARAFTYQTAALRDRDKLTATHAAQAKILASETALRVCDEAIQIHGGFGYTDDADVHRHWRDARLMTIGEGTSEILRLLVAREALKLKKQPR